MAGLRGRTFGGYQLVEQLPGGGIADVYRGRPTKAGGRDVVVKVIYPEFAHQPGFLPHFRQIVASSSKLASHPHVLPLIASGEDSGYLYLVTPYVEAGTLRDWLRRGGRMSVGDAAPFFRQLCDALTYAHSLSVVHGNLKPSNIFLFEGRHVLVGDFGMLWDVSHMDMNHAGSGTESVEFLAPEVFSGHVTQLSDIYSVGALLFATLTGHAPFQATTPADVLAAAARQPVPHLAQANPTLAASAQTLDSVIQKAMGKRPEDRFPSAAAVAQFIETSARQPVAAMSGPMPLGPTPLSPQQSPSAFLASTALPQGQGGAMAPGGMPFPAPAISLAQAAAAIASGAVSSLAQLDPPFPPLPAAAKPEAQMEQARIGGLNGTGMRPAIRQPAGSPAAGGLPFSESTIHAPAPIGAHVPQQTTLRVPAPAPPDLPQQPTMRVPSTDLSMHPNAAKQPGMAPNMPPGLDAPPAPRAVRISGAPRAKLGRSSGAPFPALEDDDEEFAPQNMPAVRRPLAQNGFAVAGGTGTFDPGARGISPTPGAGFAQEALPGSAPLDTGTPESTLLAGTSFGGPSGANGYTGRTGESSLLDGSTPYGESNMLNGAGAEYTNFAESSSPAWSGNLRANDSGAQGGWGNGYTGEQSGSPGYAGQYESRQSGARWGERGEENSGDYSGQLSGGYAGGYGESLTGEYFGAQGEPGYSGDLGRHQMDAGGEGHPVSATQLGLPRLTSPALMDRPPSWHEILSDSGGLPGGMASGMGMGMGAPATHSAPDERAPTWQDAGESMWQPAVRPPANPEPRVPAHVEAEWMGTGVAQGGWDAPAEQSGKRKKGKGARHEEPYDSGFDDDRVWTVGTTAVRVRRRWPRKLALLLLLILLIDLAALVVLRPDLCPTQSCRTLSSAVRHQLGLSQSAPASTPFAATPSSVTLTVTIGKSGNTNVAISNGTSGTVTWKASSGLPWITVNPASGILAANGAATLLLTAKPTNIKAGTYTTNITVTFAGASPKTVTIPVTISVTA